MEESRIKEMEEVWNSLKKLRGSRNWDDLVDALERALETLDYRCPRYPHIHSPLTVKRPIPVPDPDRRQQADVKGAALGDAQADQPGLREAGSGEPPPPRGPRGPCDSQRARAR